jgi:hypothetical protein
MKLLQHVAAFFVAATLVSTASAQTKIYITGSTAFRSATTNAIDAILSGTVTKASDNATYTSANAVTWTGGNIGGTAVTIKTSWSGSAGGIQTVAGKKTVRFLPDGATGTANADPRNTANAAEVAIPDIAMADNLQSSTFFNGTFQGDTYAALTDFAVGVIPFRWVASNGFPGSISMTNQLAQYLYGAGVIPLAMFTGDSAHQGTVVVAGGRDPDSGTRVVTFAESGIGVFSTVKQYLPTISGSTITALTLYPVQTINGVSTQFDGNSGESSGSTLRGFTNKTLTSGAYTSVGGTNGGYFMAYMGVSDAASALGASPTPTALLWNGTDFSVAAVQEGRYTFWGYEHLLYRPTLGNGTTDGPAIKLTAATNLKNQILGTAQSSLTPNVKLDTMNVSRELEGAPIVSTYF